MMCPLNRRLVIFENARTMLYLFLASARICFMSGIDVSGVPAVSEPSKRIMLLLRVLAVIDWSHLSSRFAMRVGICCRLGRL